MLSVRADEGVVMNRTASLVCLTLCAVAGADPIDAARMTGPFQDDPGFGALKPNDKTSLALAAYSSASNKAFINSMGHAPVKNGGEQYIGTTTKGDSVMAQWHEVVGATSNTIQVIWRTENKTDLIPAGTMVNGVPAQHLGWRVGVVDPMQFKKNVASINLVEVTAMTSKNAGLTFELTNLTSTFPAQWNGIDDGRVLSGVVGKGVNMMILEYTYSVTLVPAPASGAALLLGSLAMTRRRRA